MIDVSTRPAQAKQQTLGKKQNNSPASPKPEHLLSVPLKKEGKKEGRKYIVGRWIAS